MFICGCLAIGGSSEPHQITKYLPVQSDGCIFVANGSGDSGSLTQNLASVLQDHPLSLEVETYAWSHGKGQSVTDHIDRDNHTYQGKRLAEQVLRYQAARRQSTIYLMGHSTGCAVILEAAERLPPGSVQKIVLLAPSVSDRYDLRPALITSQRGIDSYFSEQDQLVLGLGISILGTTDPSSRSAAGLTGFRLLFSGPQDSVLYQKLFQHRWTPAMERTGNKGGHQGSIAPGFLKEFVVPQMLK